MRAPLVAVVVLAAVGTCLDGYAQTHRGWTLRCVEVYEGSRAVQADVQVLLNSKLTATLSAQALSLFGALNGAKVRASLSDITKGEPIGPTRKRPIQAALHGTVKLSDGRKCTVTGSAGSKSVNGRVYRWGRVEFAIVCPDGAKFSVGVYDSRILQPLGNGGSIPDCPS